LLEEAKVLISTSYPRVQCPSSALFSEPKFLNDYSRIEKTFIIGTINRVGTISREVRFSIKKAQASIIFYKGYE
jgi:hypothetical protein